MFRLCSLVVLLSRCLNVLFFQQGYVLIICVVSANKCFSVLLSPSKHMFLFSVWYVPTNAYLFWHGHTVCKFSGKSPLSSHKTTLKQQINGLKRLQMREKNLPCVSCVFVAYSVLGRLLASVDVNNALFCLSKRYLSRHFNHALFCLSKRCPSRRFNHALFCLSMNLQQAQVMSKQTF